MPGTLNPPAASQAQDFQEAAGNAGRPPIRDPVEACCKTSDPKKAGPLMYAGSIGNQVNGAYFYSIEPGPKKYHQPI